ncbi:MAG TPA: lysoplasmalogenase [Ferruginibacter sp.]|nr:lysoplasmalogenase [Chitinophagaceae bacterium]HRI24528.1 lysoplasmalogenase [Ferruginibacter sp.]
MQSSNQKKITLAFAVLALMNIAGIITGSENLHYITKPLLVPALLLLLYVTPARAARKALLMTGLFFSWAGDVFLLFESKNALFFIFGLVCFLITHLFYISYFLKIRSGNPSLLKKYPLLIALVAAYGVSLVWLLYPHLADLKIPVMVYAAVICSMLLSSLHVFLKINRKAAAAYLAGAAFFVLSDSLLAVNKFYQPFAAAGALIMITYCAAQYFIVRGYIEQES